MAKRPIGIGKLLEATLGRHGIKKQVTAAMVVVRANELLAEYLQPPLRDDVRTASYNDSKLTLGCRTAAAAYEVQPLMADIGKRIEEYIPDITITSYDVRIKPEMWREW